MRTPPDCGGPAPARASAGAIRGVVASDPWGRRVPHAQPITTSPTTGRVRPVLTACAEGARLASGHSHGPRPIGQAPGPQPQPAAGPRSASSSLGPGRLWGRSTLRKDCRESAAADPSEENPRPRSRRSNRPQGPAHRETRARHRRFPREDRTAPRPACSRPRETAQRQTRRRPRADHAVRAVPVPLGHENHHGPTGVAYELDSRRPNLASAFGSIQDR
jgi:hypothetical protein